MRILIYNPSARIGGAISILKDLYLEISKISISPDEYVFVVGNIELSDTKKITIYKYPWVQRNWINRVCFDLFVAPRLIKKYKVDKVVSYQNMLIPFVKVPQTLYLQQSLPFINKRFTLRESKRLWLYQNVICKLVINSVKKATEIIVQTHWMEKACIEKYNIPSDRIVVQPPRISVNERYKYVHTVESKKTFFYPASDLLYKNHKVIIDACLKLKLQNINEYRVFFTLKGDENEHISGLKEDCIRNQLNIEFIGHLNREKVYDFYCKSILLFPSYVETFGLPLLEAKLVGAPIIASDMPFSHEILDNYDQVTYFEAFDSDKLAYLMMILINKTI